MAKVGSQRKEIVEFKGCYHELHKEPNKEEINAKVLNFLMGILGDKQRVKPFGVFNDKLIRYGSLRKRKSQGSVVKKLIYIVVYLIIGLM